MAPKYSKTSDIWRHFSSVGERQYQCAHCPQQLRVTRGSSANLFRHMKKKHPHIEVNRLTHSAPIRIDLLADTCESVGITQTKLFSKSVKSKPIDTGSSVYKNYPKMHFKVENNPLEFVSTNDEFTSLKWSKFNEQLVKMIVKELHPVSLVLDDEFRKFVKLLCPNYDLPTTKVVSEELIPKMYSSAEEQVKESVSHAHAICLTADSWTATNGTKHAAIAAHYINDETRLVSNHLGLLSYDDHTENLCNSLRELLQEWNVENKIIAITCDENADITFALQNERWSHIPCFVHAFNSIMQKSIFHIEDTVMKLRTIVKYIKGKSSNILESEEEESIAILKLLPDDVVCWVSKYNLLVGAIKIKDSIIVPMSDIYIDLIGLTSEEWEIVMKACDILQLFYAIMEEISAEKMISMSKTVIFARSMTNCVENFTKENSTHHECIRNMLLSMKDNVGQSMLFYEENELSMQAALLDPRFKRLSFSDRNKYDIAYASLSSEVCEVELPIVTPSHSSTLDRNSIIWQQFDQEVEKCRSNQKDTDAGMVELNAFLSEPLLDRNEDPLVWWSQSKHLYPRLYNIALNRLNIMATSEPCDRLFSESGQLIRDKRARIKSSKLAQIIFLNANLE